MKFIDSASTKNIRTNGEAYWGILMAVCTHHNL